MSQACVEGERVLFVSRVAAGVLGIAFDAVAVGRGVKAMPVRLNTRAKPRLMDKGFIVTMF